MHNFKLLFAGFLHNLILLLTKAKLISWYITGYHQVFAKVYDQIAFPNNLLRDLVVARIVYPKSKLATIRFLNQKLGIVVSKDQIYRFLDKLNKSQISKIAYQFVSRKHQGNLSLIFYDVTTLYFESNKENQLKQKGYSKDHRHDMPQIMIGLCVDYDGYPFDFSVFKGKTFEGHTLVKMITYLKQKYDFDQLTVVADAGMLSRDNLNFLQEQNIGYIVGARLKNLPQKLKNEITSYDYNKKSILETEYQNKRLLVDYSIKRAKKDKLNRDKKIQKLQHKLSQKQTLIRKSKYLKTSGKDKVIGIDKKKIAQDAKYDGLKGYLANQTYQEQKLLPAKTIISHYHKLWKVEKAFRMSKHDLQERPIYHSKPSRIKAHITLCFASLLVMKEVETILSKKQLSVETAIELLSQVGQGKIRIGKTILDLESEVDQVTQSLLDLF